VGLVDGASWVRQADGVADVAVASRQHGESCHCVVGSSGGSKGGAGGAPAPPNFLISMLITVAKT